jgi:class 3 adenylate cyclase
VRAAIMICDLRDFTSISDSWPRDDVIDLLNAYFDAMSEPIARHGRSFVDCRAAPGMCTENLIRVEWSSN